jgi:hypothetical protein
MKRGRAMKKRETRSAETRTLAVHPEFLALIERSRARLRAEGGISSDEMRRRLQRPPRTAARRSKE